MIAIATPLLGAKITVSPQPWQVLQREADGHAPVTLAGTWYADGPGTVEVRVAREDDNASAAGCDWQAAETLEDGTWQTTLRVPTGGLYRLETRLRKHGDDWLLTGDKIWHLAVGDVWVIAGQSNAVGFGHGPVVDPPALGVSVFAGSGEWRLATHPIFDPTNTQFPANRDGGWSDVSPWLTFGKEILRQAGVPIGLIPAALGGSALSAWDPGNPDGAHLYENMVRMIAAAGGHIAGMVWYQGCTDADGEERAASYLARFTRFVEAVRARYGAGLPVITAQLNRIVKVDAAEGRWRSIVREAQRQAARTIPHLAVVTTLDLPLSDFIHTSATGNVILGERFARAALGMVYGQQIPWRTVDVDGARFVDARRTAIRVRFAHVTDPLVALIRGPLPDFAVEDADGEVPLADAQLDGPDAVLLSLARPATGRTVCHNLPGNDPALMLRDHLQRPVLAFYGVAVEEP